MTAEVGRRMFVGSVVAGLPLLAGQAALAQRGGSAHAHGGSGADPVLDLLVQQMAGVHNAAQAAPRGEHFRALAAELRTMAVYERQMDVDDQVRTALRDLVDREGRNAVLYADPDVEMRRRNLQSYGFRLPARGRQPSVLPSHEQREAALDALLEHGITPAFERMAAMADRVALRIDGSRTLTVAAQDPDQEYWRAFCASLFGQYQEAQTTANPICLIARYFSPFAASCAALEGGAMVLLLAYFYECQMFG